MSLSKDMDLYLEHLRALNYSHETVKGIRKALRYFIRFMDSIDVKNASEVLKKHLQAYQTHLYRHKTAKGLPLKPRVQNRRIAAVKGFIKHLSGNGQMLESLLGAMDYLKEPSMLPSSVMNHSQVKKILTRIDTSTQSGYRDRTMLELMYSCGIRAGEIVGLNLSSVDFRNQTLTVFGKGSKQRVVPIGKTALKYLETYVKGIRSFMLRGSPTNALFINHYGRRLLYGSLLRIVHQYFDKASADMIITPHTFRRSCATELIRNGANLYHVKDLLGHEDLQSLKAYTKLTINDLKATHAKFHPREKD